MGQLSCLNMATRRSVQIPVQPWFKDHSFNGQTIFPAVESMLLLAEIAEKINNEIHVTCMRRVSFPKLLNIPTHAKEFSALVEYDEDITNHQLTVKLLTKTQFTKMSRIREHAKITFPVRPFTILDVAPITTENDIHIEAERIYRELVPFGPSYHSLIGTLRISKNGAKGTLHAPCLAHQHKMEKKMGSPFPLDGAMHAACVFGQCVSDFVPFPVGFEKRVIQRPTQAGKKYKTSVIITSQMETELIFNLSIFDSAGNICETVEGLKMRDVTRGKVTPPTDLPRLTVFP